MFPNPMPEMPAEFMEAVQNDPAAFGEAMAAGQEAFGDAMANGGDPAAAFEAMGDVMGPMMSDMGVSQEVFDAAGEALGAAVGPAMTMAPVDAGGEEMGAIMQDACTMLSPEGDVPAPVMDAMADFGTACGDTGVGPHELGADMMDNPGEPGYPLPVDGDGGAVVVPGDPASCPAEACQPPPEDGAVAAMGEPLMAPEGGYDHVPATPDMQMADPAATDDAAAALGGALGGEDAMAAPMGDDAAADAALTMAMDAASGGEATPAPEADSAAAMGDDSAAGMEQPPEPEDDSAAGMGG